MHWGYCRVSSEEQAQGQSIDSQFRRLLERGIPEDQILVEIGSASKARTPELQRLFRLARAGHVKSITAIRQDRFQRNRRTAAALWELIDQHNVAFRFLDQPDIDPADPTSILQAQILGAFAQFETEQLSQRVKNGLQQNRLMKKHHGRPPAGYVNDDGHLRPDPATWDVYRQVIDCYLETGSSTAARRLRHQLTGVPWSVSSFARWLTSPALRGAVTWGTRTDKPELCFGQHEPLITSAEWDQIQAIRAANRRSPGAFRKSPPTIGSGLFVCSSCGGKLSYRQRTTKNHAVYRCQTVRGGGCEQGHTNWFPLADVATEIRRAVRIAAQQLAEYSTPKDVEEPQELVDLRVERQRLIASKGRAEWIAQVDADIAAAEARLTVDAPQRQAKVKEEFQRLKDEPMDDDSLRSIALRYGLQMTVDARKVIRVSWERLGPVFPGFMAGGDLSVLDVPMTKVKHVTVTLPEGWEAEALRG